MHAEEIIQLLNYTKHIFSILNIKFWIAFERLSIQTDNARLHMTIEP